MNVLAWFGSVRCLLSFAVCEQLKAVVSKILEL